MTPELPNMPYVTIAQVNLTMIMNMFTSSVKSAEIPVVWTKYPFPELLFQKDISQKK
jgi:hypothetical protein